MVWIGALLITAGALMGCTIKVEPIAKKEPVKYHAKKHVSKPHPTPLPIYIPVVPRPNATSVPDWPQNFKLIKPANPELESTPPQ